ncbi:MAG: DUF2156 domain-containing protein [Porcipelethomonas sp.]
MLKFREISISDKIWINELLAKSDFMGCEYSFANNMAWRRLNDSLICRYKDFYIVKSEDDEFVTFTFPSGTGEYRELFEKLGGYARISDKRALISGITSYGIDILKKIYGEKIRFELSEDYSDYIYLAEDLIGLKGRKFHKKRNHLAKINRYNWEFHPMTEKDFDECTAFSAESYNFKNGYDDHSAIVEQYAIYTYFSHFRELDLKGGVITIDGKVKAFTIGEQLNSNTLCVHIEKADPSIDGLYAAINNEFAKYAAGNLKYINREEDLGIEGLRKAKRSYNPVFILEKYTAELPL